MAKRPLTPEEAEVKRRHKLDLALIATKKYQAANREKVLASARKRDPIRKKKERHRNKELGIKPKTRLLTEKQREKIRENESNRYYADRENKANSKRIVAEKIRRKKGIPQKVFYKKEENGEEKKKASLKNSKTKYVSKNKEKYRVYQSNRRALKKGNGGKHTVDDIKNLFDKQKGICVYCKIDISDKYCIDHIVALVCGGSNGPENLQLTCVYCNGSKGKKSHDEFLIYRTKKLKP